MALHRAGPVINVSTIVEHHYVGIWVLVIYTGLVYHLADDYLESVFILMATWSNCSFDPWGAKFSP
jgi:hypothetical protein